MALTLDYHADSLAHPDRLGGRTKRAGLKARLVTLWRRWQRARRDREALLAMDYRARRDVGITLGEVRTAYRQPWWRWPLT